MTRTVSPRLALAVAAASAVAAAAPALADPSVSGSPSAVEVSVSTPGPGSRQLSVLDLTGAPLRALPLRPGFPSPFRVQVTGVGQLTQTVNGVVQTNAGAGFTVTATMNNLYAPGAVSTAPFIQASDVSVGFPAGGAKQALADVAVLPRTLLNGTTATCAGALALPALSGLNALTGTGLVLCDALGTGGVAISNLEVVSDAEQLVQDLADVPFTLAGQQSGAFTLADYANGIGAADTRGNGANGTPRSLLSGVPSVPTALTTALNTALAPLAGQPALSATGAGAQTAVADVLGALSAVPSLSSLYAALRLLTPAQVAAVLGTLTGALQPIGLGDITGVTGTYSSFPVLTANPSTTPAGGTYKGTMTVTLVQP